MLIASFEPAWWDWLIVLVLAVFMPAHTALVTLPKILALPKHEVERMRPAIYGQAVVTQWLFAGTAIYLVLARGVGWEEIGFTVTSDGMLHGLGLVLALFVVLLYMRRKIVRDPQGKLSVRQALGRRIQWLLPRTPGQRRGWWVVSAHAGWGEELFYRGFLLFLLASFMPLWAAALISTVMFGCAHLYQGVSGIIKTGVLGGVFLGLFLVSGSLIVPIIAHAMYDVWAGELGYWALKEEPIPEAPQQGRDTPAEERAPDETDTPDG